MAALLPGAAIAAVGEAVPPAVQQQGPDRSESFTPPPSGAVLTREVRRPLAPGLDLVVRRSFALEVRREGDGFIVNGTQVAVEVDAPPSLAALADLERQRREVLLFPMHLDARGMIRPDGDTTPARTAKAEDLGRANQLVSGMVSQSDLSADEGRQVSAFMAQSVAQGRFSLTPGDLFRPTPGKRSETRAFRMPDGQQGRLTIAIEASAGHSGGPLASTIRTVTTEYAGTERINRESWRIDLPARQP